MISRSLQPELWIQGALAIQSQSSRPFGSLEYPPPSTQVTVHLADSDRKTAAFVLQNRDGYSRPLPSVAHRCN